MACSSCAKRRAAAGLRRPTMMRVETEWFEVIAGDGRRVRYATIDEARDNLNGGQLRRRVSYQDVPAEYAVRLEDSEIGRFPRAMDAAEVSKQYPGATVHMVAATVE